MRASNSIGITNSNLKIQTWLVEYKDHAIELILYWVHNINTLVYTQSRTNKGLPLLLNLGSLHCYITSNITSNDEAHGTPRRQLQFYNPQANWKSHICSFVFAWGSGLFPRSSLFLSTTFEGHGRNTFLTSCTGCSSYDMCPCCTIILVEHKNKNAENLFLGQLRWLIWSQLPWLQNKVDII